MRSRFASAAAALAVLVVLVLTLGPATPSELSDFEACIICGDRGSADAVLNVLLFVPVGAALALRFGMVRGVLLGAALSLIVEIVQFWSPLRHSSFGDILFNGSGALLGAMLLTAPVRAIVRDARRCAVAAVAAAAAAALVLALGTWMLGPSVPEGPWWGQWTPRLGRFDAYEGRVTSARIGGVDIPSHRVPRLPALRDAVARGDALELTVLAGAPPAGVAPIFAIGDATERQVLMVAAVGDQLIYRRYTLASALRFTTPDFRFERALASIAPGDTLGIVVRAAPDAARARVVIDGAAQDARLGALDTWSLLLWPESIARSARRRTLAGIAWIALLFAPAMLLAGRASILARGVPKWRRAQGTPSTTISSSARVALIAALLGLVACGTDEGHVSAGVHRLAVLGDSDSHAYRDSVSGVRRGGEHHDVAYQWTEVLAATRAQYFDQGEFGVFGTRAILARARAAVGLEAKSPRKQDFRWNYARSGARCESLLRERPMQARWLASALRADREGWRDGLVVIRIGVNDLGQDRHLDEYAREGLGATQRATVDACIRAIADAIGVIRGASPDVRILLVGIADDSSWPHGDVPRRTAPDVARIRAVLDFFDARLRELTQTTDGVAFMNDRDWYTAHWAERDSAGDSQLSGYSLGGRTEVANTRGDAPNHLALGDGHAGTVANGLFAQELIRAVDRAFGWDVPTLTDAEIAAIADPDGRYGIAPVQP